MSNFFPNEKFPVKGINFLSKLHILFDIRLSKIMLFRAKYLSKTTIFPRSETINIHDKFLSGQVEPVPAQHIYNCSHGAGVAIKPELNLVQYQQLPHQVFPLVMVMQELQVRDCQLDPGVSQVGAGEEE